MFSCRHYSSKFFCILFVLVIFPLAVWAQQSTGLVGTITDSTGAAVGGTTVTAKNVSNGEIRQAISNEGGEYTVPNLRAGTYEVRAEKQGFQLRVVEHVVLDVQSFRTIDFVLSPGSVSEYVSVNASSSALQTTESSVSPGSRGKQ